MASSGWQTEQNIYDPGGNMATAVNIYIGSITRNTNSVRVTGTARVIIRGSYFWYSDELNGKMHYSDSDQGGEWQFKGWTSGSILTGTTYDHAFDVTIGGLSPTDTKTNIGFHTWDPRNPSFTKIDAVRTWEIKFDKAEQPPSVSCGNTYSNNPSVWRLQSGISDIDWGVGYKYRKITAVVSYTFQGQSYSYTAGTWTDGSTKVSFDINAYNDSEPWKKVPAGANAKVTWTVSTGISPDAVCSTTVLCKAPNTPTIPTITTSNPSVYRLASTVSGINWGDYYKSRTLSATVSYTLDGVSYSYTAKTDTSGATSSSFDIDAVTESIPWSKVPDDETVTVTWRATINVGYGTLTGVASKTQSCQPSYTAYVIEQGVNSGKPVEADLMISNTTGSVPNKGIRRIAQIDG